MLGTVENRYSIEHQIWSSPVQQNHIGKARRPEHLWEEAMQPLKTCIRDLRDIRTTGADVREIASCGADDARCVRDMVHHVAAVAPMEPALDANYAAVKASASALDNEPSLPAEVTL